MPLDRDSSGQPIPHGFETIEDYRSFAILLREGLPEGVQPLFQGSSVTGKSHRTGKPFEVDRRSDFDIALAGRHLFDRARSLGLKIKNGERIGPVSPQILEILGLSDLVHQVSDLAGRPVNFMLFDSVESALRRPSIWVF